LTLALTFLTYLLT